MRRCHHPIAFLDAFASEDVEAVLALFTADAKFVHVGYGIELNGQDELRFLHESQFEQHDAITFTEVTGFEAAGHVAAEATWTSTNLFDAPGSNEGPDEITFRFALIGDVTEGGQLSRLAFYQDTYQVNVQVGLSEATPDASPPPA